MPRKPWPDIAAEEYYALMSEAETMVYLAGLLFNKAVFGRHNPVLLEKVLEVLPTICRRYALHARLANRKRGGRGGLRFPKWVVTALEDSLALATGIEQDLSRLKAAHFADDWESTKRLTKAVYEAVLGIQDYLSSGPPPEIPAVNEANEVARKFWETWGKHYG